MPPLAGTTWLTTDIQAMMERLSTQDIGKSWVFALATMDKAVTDAGLADSTIDAGDLTIDPASMLTAQTDLQSWLEEVGQGGVDGALMLGVAADGLLVGTTTLRNQLAEFTTGGVDGALKIGVAAAGGTDLLVGTTHLRNQLQEITSTGVDGALKIGVAANGLLVGVTTLRNQLAEFTTATVDGALKIGVAADGLLVGTTTLRDQLQEFTTGGVDGALIIGAAATGLLVGTTHLRDQLQEFTTGGVDGALIIGVAADGLLVGTTHLRDQLQEFTTGGVDGALIIGAAATGLLATNTTLRAQLDEICTVNVDGIDKIGAAVSAPFSQGTVKTQMSEVGQHIVSAQKFIDLPATTWYAVAGTALPAWVANTTSGIRPDGGTGDVGFVVSNTGAPVINSCSLPMDWDVAANIVVHVHMERTAAASDLTVICYASELSNVGNAAAVTLVLAAEGAGSSTELTGNITPANLTTALGGGGATQGVPLQLSFNLDCDVNDIIIHGFWLEYTGVMLTA